MAEDKAKAQAQEDTQQESDEPEQTEPSVPTVQDFVPETVEPVGEVNAGAPGWSDKETAAVAATNTARATIAALAEGMPSSTMDILKTVAKREGCKQTDNIYCVLMHFGNSPYAS